MMFEEISQLVAAAGPQPSDMEMSEVLCYQSLAILLDRFAMGTIDQEQATAEKQRIKAAFTTRQRVDHLYSRMFDTYQKNIHASATLRVSINKAKDKPPAELFAMAVQCISAMTGDTVFLKNANKVALLPVGGD